MNKVKTDLVVSVYGPGGWIEVPVYRVAPPRTGLTVRLGVAAMLLFLCITFAAVGRGESGNAAARTTVEGSSASAVVLAQVSPQQIGDSANIGLWWLGGVLVVLQVVSFFRPQPALHKQFADKEDLEKKLDHVWEVIRGLRGAIGEIQRDVSSIKETREGNRALLGELNHETGLHGKQLAAIEALLERHLEEHLEERGK